MTRLVALGDIAEVNPGVPSELRSADPDMTVPFLPMAAVSEEGAPSYVEQRRLADVLKGFTCFAKGDVILAKITPCFENGKAAYLHDLPDAVGFGSTEFHVLRPGPEVDGLYLFHAIWNREFRVRGQANMTGTAGQKRVPTSYLRAAKIPLPSLAEQRRIAGVLDRVEGVRGKREKRQRLVDNLLHSVFLDMFGDPVRNEKRWDRRTLGELARVRRGASPRPIEQFMGGTVPWIVIGDATSSTSLYIRRTNRFVTEEGAAKSVLLHPGAIVVANSGVSLGFARILGISGCIHDGWLSVECLDPRVHPVYFVNLINAMTRRLRAMAPKGTQPNLNTAILKALSIPLPPIAAQRKFAECVQVIARLSARHQESDCVFARLSRAVVSQVLS